MASWSDEPQRFLTVPSSGRVGVEALVCLALAIAANPSVYLLGRF